jgi:hypothetical protein
MLREAITASPLYWPANQPRTQVTEGSAFGIHSVDSQTQFILAELARMGVASAQVKISTNVRLRKDGLPYSNSGQPYDAGVAVWFQLNEVEHVLACDKWHRLEHNMRAIAKHIEALRAQERWGVGSLEQSFRGFVAIAERVGRPWREVLGFAPESTPSLSQVKLAYRTAAKDRHPDMETGSLQLWHELQTAHKAAERETP